MDGAPVAKVTSVGLVRDERTVAQEGDRKAEEAVVIRPVRCHKPRFLLPAVSRADIHVSRARCRIAGILADRPDDCAVARTGDRKPEFVGESSPLRSERYEACLLDRGDDAKRRGLGRRGKRDEREQNGQKA